MEKPTCSAETALTQAGSTIKQYLHQAQDGIDAVFGKGYAKANPELVGQCVVAQTSDFNCTALTAALYEVAAAIEERSKLS